MWLMMTLKITKNSVSLSPSSSLCLSTENAFLEKLRGGQSLNLFKVKCKICIDDNKRNDNISIDLAAGSDEIFARSEEFGKL